MANGINLGGVITYSDNAIDSSKTLIVSNSNNSSVTLEANISVADAGKRTKSVKIVGNKSDNSIKGGSGADTLEGAAGNDTLTGGKGKDVFIYSGGNDVITDYTAGTDKIKISDDEITNMEIEEEEDVVFYFSKGGTLTVKSAIKNGKAKKITITNKDDVTSAQAYGAESLTIANGDGSIINLVDNAYAENASAAARTKAVRIIGNDYDNVIKGGKGNDTLEGGEGDDTLTGGAGADVFIYTGGDVVITDYNSTQKDVIRLVDVDMESDSYYFSGKDVVFETDSGNLTILNGKGKEITWFNSIGKSTSKAYVDASEKVFSKDATIKSYSANSYIKSNIVTIDASALKQAIKITGNNNDNFIKGGNGADTLFGTAKGDNTLIGGAGNDVFIHEGGNTVITDYKVGADIIKLNAELVSAEITGEKETDLLFKFKNNSTLTVLNVVKVSKTTKTPQKLTITNKWNKTTTRAYALESITLTNSDSDSFNASIDLNDTLKKISASKRTKAITIIGNNNENSIIGGSKNDTIIAGTKSSTLSGGNGNDSIKGSAEADSISGGSGADVLYGLDGDDTIYGGAGNDTLYGGDGNDIFVYNSGNGSDVIMDYEVGDVIKLGKGLKVKKSAKSGKDYVLTIGSNKLTLKNAADKNISVVNSKNEYSNYNESAYQESAYIERESDFWFAEDDVMMNNSSGLDSILQNDSNSTAITTDKLTSLVIDEIESKSISFSDITYSQEKK